MNKIKRVSWDEYFMKIAYMVATRSTCNKISVGTVFTQHKRIVATGYNGAPAGMPHCTEIGCIEYNNHCINALHSEVNAILQCAANGVATEGAVVYCTHLPCWHCTMMLINARIKKLYYSENYVDDRGDQLKLFKQVNLPVEQLPVYLNEVYE
jgi:dCMP deaminase